MMMVIIHTGNMFGIEIEATTQGSVRSIWVRNIN